MIGILVQKSIVKAPLNPVVQIHKRMKTKLIISFLKQNQDESFLKQNHEIGK